MVPTMVNIHFGSVAYLFTIDLCHIDSVVSLGGSQQSSFCPVMKCFPHVIWCHFSVRSFLAI